MTKYLTQEWLDEARALAQTMPERPAASARIQYLVAKGPDGDVAYWWRLEDGILRESALGRIDEPDVTLSLSYEDATKIQRGDLDMNAAFMQGRMKAAGDMGKLMTLMPITNSPEYKALQVEIRAITDY
jgi:alkyl sulfatase BDS1-like metallo-beta-lactamase superfamily hydrolase